MDASGTSADDVNTRPPKAVKAAARRLLVDLGAGGLSLDAVAASVILP
ncbi:hypothetical protein [Streptomyces sp. YGL11-2]